MSLDWKQVHPLPRLVTVDSYSFSFQYKILNNVLHLNEKRFSLRSTSLPCSFSKRFGEAILQLFCGCNKVQSLWNDLALFSENDFALFDLIPQSAFVVFLIPIQNYFLYKIKCF